MSTTALEKPHLTPQPITVGVNWDPGDDGGYRMLHFARHQATIWSLNVYWFVTVNLNVGASFTVTVPANSSRAGVCTTFLTN